MTSIDRGERHDDVPAGRMGSKLCTGPRAGLAALVALLGTSVLMAEARGSQDDAPQVAAPDSQNEPLDAASQPPKSRPASDAADVPDPRHKDMQVQVLELLTEKRNAVIEHPTDPARWKELGIACNAHKLFNCAETCYRRSLELRPDEFSVLYFLAHLLDSTGRHDDESLTLYRAAEKLNALYEPLYYRMGSALERRDRLAEAKEAYQKAISVNPGFAPAQRALGQAMLASGEAEKALKHLNLAAQLAPNDYATMSAIASARRQLGLPQLFASTEFDAGANVQYDIPDPILNVIKRTAVDSSSLLRRAKDMIHHGRHGEAISDLKLAERATPEDPYVHIYLGTCYHRIGEVGLAAAHLKNAVRLNEEIAAAHLEFAIVLIDIGRLSQGLHHYDRAVALSPLPRDIHIWIAGALFAKRHWKYAAEAYESAAGIASLDSKSFVRWGMSLFHLEDFEGAADKFKRATRVNTSYVDAYYNCGLCLEKLGRLEEAKEQYEKVLSLEPDHPRAGMRLESVTTFSSIPDDITP